ncbi:GNAT family N-acetyltransferase [Xaviernesmea oryzae]|uniref:GNAT family N-acetyltransferase n=1 Tax=Xaviernesmea oryzae TaxID=464029 RepID=A0A1Q9B0D6_9HYPH|nr:N-acetyltransferase [Xaviernesmea oryzae]OLP61435.1 GNAT family N-acetyltransferase [Xaviernesmea oryzae]SEL69321.1 putative acetyltransferase [Xaviernesmea oryzae]
MLIRPETAEDVSAIRALTKMAFAKVAYSSGTEAEIIATLRAADALSLSLVAEDAGTILGHVAFSPVRLDGRDEGWVGLGPISVRPDRQGQGLGGALIRTGLKQLQQLGAQGCVLLGDPAYYGRFGFRAVDGLFYEDAPAEYFLALAFDGQMPAGQVDFHEAFAVGPDTQV